QTYTVNVHFISKTSATLTRSLNVTTDSDECSNGESRCEQICIERYKFEDSRGYECNCQRGFVLSSDRETCTDVDECSRGTHRCDQNAGICDNVLGSYICSCKEGYENDGFICKEKRLFQYGQDCGDIKLVGESRDFNSPIINIPQGFPFDDAFYYRLYVYDFQNKTDAHSQTLQREIEEHVNNYYGSELNITSFSPKWALKITWENVLPYTGYQNTDPNGTNTYQAVLTTDGIFSFCLIQFKDGGMNWKYDIRPYYRNYALMGYYSGSLRSYLNSDMSLVFNDPQTRFNVPPEKIYHPDRYPGFKTGFFFGDPHVVTLDSVKYTFNGLGEFIVLNVIDDNGALTFTLHGRTLRAGVNRTSQATSFVALAARGPSGTKVQWNLNDDDEISVMVDGSIFEVTGVWNDDKTDDFKASDGTYLDFDGTNLPNETQIFFNFGMTYINECLDYNACPARNSICTNTNGSYTCSCSAGYEGSNCSVINECNSCSPYSQCTFDGQSYNCTCKPGFSGNGTTCIPLPSPCGSSQCSPSFCKNGGTCVPNPDDGCKPFCQCPRQYGGEQCTLASLQFVAEPLSTMPKRSVNITLRLQGINVTVLSNRSSIDYISLTNSTSVKVCLDMSHGETVTAAVVTLFNYNGNKVVIDFLNDGLYAAIQNAFNNLQRLTRALTPDTISFEYLNRTDIKDISRLSYNDLLNHLSCNDTEFTGYVLQWNDESGVICRSPCDLNYCLNEAECQHLTTGPMCK
ncbi:hypothetical protein chiPu_0017766, partial [Chiloscyllium punctatum]|nr:hypothetical protein [Chiloscyllium punctatum]